MAVTRLCLAGNNAFTSDRGDFVVLHSPAAGTMVLPVVCRHRGGPLNLATFNAQAAVCPWHGNQTRCPSPRSRRSPFVLVRTGRMVTLIGRDVERTYRLPVLNERAH